MKKVNYSISAAITCIFTLVSSVVLSQTLTYPIVGTGVSQCYGNLTSIACPANTTDPFYGQFPGATPSYHDNGDGTISDLNTGLMWVKARGSKISWDSAMLMAHYCTAGGHNDWRMPAIKELYSLINYNGKSSRSPDSCIAYLDTNFFQMAYGAGDTMVGSRTIDAQDWSATKYTALTMNGDTTIFGVNFIDGRIKGYPKYKPPTLSPDTLYVRYVRGNTNYGVNKFTDLGDSTIVDSATGLMWAKNDAGSGMNWQSALAYAQTKNTANYLGHNDWRLPNAKELQSIVDYTRSPMATHSAAINPVFNCMAITDEGGHNDYPFFWSSTTHLDNLYGVYVCFGAALGWMHMPPTATYYMATDVHGAGAQRSDPKAGSVTTFYMGTDSLGGPCYGQGPQGDVIRINNYVRLVRTAINATGTNEIKDNHSLNVYPNPVLDICTVSFNEQRSMIKIELINILGSKVKELYKTNTNTVQINLTDLPKGVFIMNVSFDNYLSTRKIIKL